MGHCEEVEEEFAKLRDYFLNRGHHPFDMQDTMNELRDLARGGKTMTYGELMSRFHVSRGRIHGIAELLWRISEMEACLVGPSHDPPHFISAVVVRSTSGYPSGGFFGLAGIPPDLERPERLYVDSVLSDDEKRYVEKIWDHLRHCPKRGGTGAGGH